MEGKVKKMSHEITQYDTVTAVGDTWHDKHERREALYTLAEAFSGALHFQVVAVPLRMASGRETDRIALCVDDAEGRILGYATTDYRIWQNAEQLAVCERVAEKSALPDRCVSSSGTVKAQRECFVSMEVPSGFTNPVLNGRADPLATFLNWSWGHDGSTPWGVSLKTFRQVCHNTFHLSRMGSNVFLQKHCRTMDVLIDRAVGLLEAAPTYAARIAEQAEKLACRRLTDANEMRDWIGRAAVADILGDVAPLSRWDCSLDQIIEETIRGGTETARGSEARLTRYRETAGTMRHLAKYGRGNSGETYWDVFNGVTEYTDHSRKMRGDEKAEKRLAYAQSGFGDELKSSLLDSLVSAAA